MEMTHITKSQIDSDYYVFEKKANVKQLGVGRHTVYGVFPHRNKNTSVKMPRSDETDDHEELSTAFFAFPALVDAPFNFLVLRPNTVA